MNLINYSAVKLSPLAKSSLLLLLGVTFTGCRPIGSHSLSDGNESPIKIFVSQGSDGGQNLLIAAPSLYDSAQISELGSDDQGSPLKWYATFPQSAQTDYNFFQPANNDTNKTIEFSAEIGKKYQVIVFQKADDQVRLPRNFEIVAPGQLSFGPGVSSWNLISFKNQSNSSALYNSLKSLAGNNETLASNIPQNFKIAEGSGCLIYIDSSASVADNENLLKIGDCRNRPTLIFSSSPSNAGVYGPITEVAKGNQFAGFAALSSQNVAKFTSCLETSLSASLSSQVGKLKKSFEECMNKNEASPNRDFLVEVSGEIESYSLTPKPQNQNSMNAGVNLGIYDYTVAGGAKLSSLLNASKQYAYIKISDSSCSACRDLFNATKKGSNTCDLVTLVNSNSDEKSKWLQFVNAKDDGKTFETDLSVAQKNFKFTGVPFHFLVNLKTGELLGSQSGSGILSEAKASCGL